MENEELEMEEASILEMTNENGQIESFEYLDAIELDGTEYLVLLPMGDGNDVVIMEVIPGDDESEAYDPVTDEELQIKVFEIFKERNADLYDFED